MSTEIDCYLLYKRGKIFCTYLKFLFLYVFNSEEMKAKQK
jgi:hypothetical protein